MRRSLFPVVGLLLALSACNRADPPPAPAAPSKPAAAASTTKSTVAASPSSKSSVAPPKTEPEVTYAFTSTIGKDTVIQVWLARVGNKLDGVYVDASGEDHALHGDVGAEEKIRFEEREAGKATASFDGALYDGLLKGTWKDDKTGKTRILVSAPLTLTESHFSQTYVGVLGGKTRVRAKLEVDAGKVHGVYRYTRSKSDLTLAGTVDDKGALALTETSGGKKTGAFRGVFLTRAYAIGKWSSPEGDRSLPFSLQASADYPEIVPLPTGGKAVPQESYDERSKACNATAIYPQLEGLASIEAQKKLNAALKTAAGPLRLSKDDCEGAAIDQPYSFETNYALTTSPRPLLGVSSWSYAYTGGAHGSYGGTCQVADLSTGALASLADSLTPDGRVQLQALVNAKLKADAHVETLTEAGFFEDEVQLGPQPWLCMSGSGLDVSFQPYEVAPYSMGAPSAHLTAAEAAPLFGKGTLGAAVYPTP